MRTPGLPNPNFPIHEFVGLFFVLFFISFSHIPYPKAVLVKADIREKVGRGCV